MDAIDKYRNRRKKRLAERLRSATDPHESSRLAIIIYKNCLVPQYNEDGGEGSGNWGHEGIPGHWGGSKGGGGKDNRISTEHGFTSMSKIKKAGAKPHIATLEELDNLAAASKVFVIEAEGEALTFQKNENGKFVNKEYGDTYTPAHFADFFEGEKVTYSIPDESVNPQYTLDKVTNNAELRTQFDHAYSAQERSDFDDEYRSQSGEIWNGLSEFAKDSIHEYTGGDSDEINAELRAHKVDQYTAESVKAISDAIDQSELKEDTILHRGVGLNAFRKMFNTDLKNINENNVADLVGLTGTDEGFMSCGSAEGTGYTDESVYMNIMAPKGSKALYIEPVSKYGRNSNPRKWDGKSTQSAFSDEDETLLQRGTSAQIIGASYVSGQIIIDAVVTGQDPYDI